jgi:hypothetical protein
LARGMRVLLLRQIGAQEAQNLKPAFRSPRRYSAPPTEGCSRYVVPDQVASGAHSDATGADQSRSPKGRT